MPRKYFIGVDEAGYGPNLGPLVIAATLWSAPTDTTEQCFMQALTQDFHTATWTPGCQHLPLGDSKKLYATRRGLATLEAGLLAMLATTGENFSTLGALIDRVLGCELVEELAALKWYAGHRSQVVPSLMDSSEVQRLAQLAQHALAPSGIQLLDVKAAVVCEPHFNRAVAKSGSKGELLSRTTLEQVVGLLASCPAETEIFCDRQGGRKNYLPNLCAAMPEEWFTEIHISPQRSSYRSTGPRPVTIHFSVGGDSFPPTALASMLAKYLRERLMQILNEYWQAQLPELKPTAGYPVDALRFRAAVEPVAQRLRLPAELWWRCK